MGHDATEDLVQKEAVLSALRNTLVRRVAEHLALDWRTKKIEGVEMPGV